MQIRTNELSDAVVLYVGFGSSSFPERDRARLVREFGDAKAMLLEPKVVFLVKEVSAIEVNWSAHTLASAGEMVRLEMQKRHPELSENALQALAWKFAFDWR